MSQPEEPLILTYDAAPKRAIPSRKVILGYWCGLAITGPVNAVGLYLATAHGYREPMFSPVVDGLVVAGFWLAAEIMLATLFLGLSLWFKAKIIKEVAFARMLPRVCWGILGGLLSPMLLTFKFPVSLQIGLGLGVLLWLCAVPAVAGQFLCYRTHLRT